MSFFQPLMQLGSLANTLGQAGLNRVEIWPAASLHSFIEWWECTFTCLLNLDTLHWYFLNSFCFWNVLPTCNQRFMMLKCAVVTQFVTYTSILFLSNDIIFDNCGRFLDVLQVWLSHLIQLSFVFLQTMGSN